MERTIALKVIAQKRQLTGVWTWQAVSSILYLDNHGGPTVVIDQTATSALGPRAWKIYPREQRLLAFSGKLLHGVLPGAYPPGICPFCKPFYPLMSREMLPAVSCLQIVTFLYGELCRGSKLMSPPTTDHKLIFQSVLEGKHASV